MKHSERKLIQALALKNLTKTYRNTTLKCIPLPFNASTTFKCTA